MGRLFGTDGVRGVAGTELTRELAGGLGRAAVAVLGRHGSGRPVVVVGRDPRSSGEWLEDALTEGIRRAGGDVRLLGVEPTPAIAYTTVDLGASAGVVISASHNPATDNGIKFFSREGTKLPDALEDEIEAALGDPAPDVDAPDHGRILPFAGAREAYVQHLVGASLAPLAGMRVVVDCANGSASEVAPDLLRRLGADVTAIHASPDGTNINDGCGALHPEVVAAEVVAPRCGCRRVARRRRRPRAVRRRRRQRDRRRSGPGRLRRRAARCRRAGGRHGRCHRHVEHRVRARDDRARHPSRPHAGRRPVRARGDGPGRFRPRRRAERACDLPAVRDDG